jgi:hypothetical protein
MKPLLQLLRQLPATVVSQCGMWLLASGQAMGFLRDLGLAWEHFNCSPIWRLFPLLRYSLGMFFGLMSVVLSGVHVHEGVFDLWWGPTNIAECIFLLFEIFPLLLKKRLSWLLNWCFTDPAVKCSSEIFPMLWRWSYLEAATRDATCVASFYSLYQHQHQLWKSSRSWARERYPEHQKAYGKLQVKCRPDPSNLESG